MSQNIMDIDEDDYLTTNAIDSIAKIQQRYYLYFKFFYSCLFCRWRLN